MGVGGRQLEHLVVSVVNQQGLAEARGRGRGDRLVGAAQQLDQGADVVAADHGGQQPDRLHRADQGAGGLGLGHRQQPAGLDVGGFINAWRDALAEQFQHKGFFASGGRRQQFGQGAGLSGCQRQGRHSQGRALGSGDAVLGQKGAGSRHRGRLAGRGPGRSGGTHCRRRPARHWSHPLHPW